MAITGTKAFAFGEKLSSSDVNQYLMRGVKVFADSSARDAAYGGTGEPVLEEGETCYLTSTDKLQTYNGSSWVDIGPAATPVITALQHAYVGTSQTTSSGSYTDLATSGPTVTITTGTSALVIVGARISVPAGTNGNGYMSFAVSGATTVSASDDYSFNYQSSNGAGSGGVKASFAYVITGLTAGSNTFTSKYRSSGTTNTYLQRQIIVMAL